MKWIIVFVLPIVIGLLPDFVIETTSFSSANPNTHLIEGSILDEAPAAYFKGHGLSPSWKLIIFPDSISFESEVSGFESIRAAHKDPVRDRNGKSYELQMAEGQLHIEIGNEACTIDGSNESFAYSLFVAFTSATDTTRTVFEGCGHYITDANLQGRWILEQIKDKPVGTNEFNNNLPTLEIQSGSNSFSGFSGCNKINGRIFSERTLLRFTDFVSTKISCDDLEKENTFLEALSFSTQFLVVGDRLILSNPVSATLILKRER